MHILLRALCALLGAGLVACALVTMGYARFGAGNVLCLLLGAPLVAVALFWSPLHAAQWGRGLLLLMKVGYALVALAVAVGCALSLRANATAPKAGADAVIVLGAGLWGEVPSPTLQRRLDAALPYLLANPDALCVVAGGQGPDEPIPEAQAMAHYLQKKGLDPTRILQEGTSRNTAQNLKNARALLQERGLSVDYAVVITSDFHLWRGRMLALGQGFGEVGGIGSATRPILLPGYVLRETASMIKDGVMGRYRYAP